MITTANVGTIVVWAVCAVAATFTCALSFVHHSDLYQMPLSKRRTLFLSIIQLAPIMVICSFLNLFFPRETDLLEMLRAIFEAITVYSFIIMLVDMMGGEEYVVVRLHKDSPPLKILSGGPCCCFFRSCDKPRFLTEDLLKWCLIFGKQFYFAVPLISFVKLFSLLGLSNRFTIQITYLLPIYIYIYIYIYMQ